MSAQESQAEFPPTLNLILNCLQTTTTSISIIACLWLFGAWHFTKPKTLGINMIAILSLGDAISHVASIHQIWFYDPTITTQVLWFIEMVSLMFSSLWGSSMAYLTY